MLYRVKLLLNLTDNEKDDLLTLLIETAIEEAMAFTHRDCIAGLESCIAEMVVYKYNRLENIGVDSESYSGASFTYSTDYPESIMRSLKSKRVLVMR
jgi:hypothetical protein